MDFDLDLDFHVFNFRPHRLFDEPYLLGWKLQNSNCDKQMIEEILRISKGIYKRRRHISSFCYLDLYSRYITVIENLKSSEEWNEVKEELQQILQEFNEKRINKIESVVWRKVFKTLSQRNSETKICDLLDVFETIENQVGLKSSYFFPVFSSRRDFTPTYETWGQYILQQAETMDFMKIKESLLELAKKIGRPWEDSTYFEITVVQLNGKRHIIKDVRGKDGVYSLIGKVADKTDIPRSKLALSYNDGILKPGQKLADWNIHDGSKLQLLPVEKGHKQPTDLKQFVNGLSNHFNGQIEEAKRLLGNLCWIFPQFVLDCTRTLSDKNFVAISSLVCGMKVLGKKLGLDKVTCDQIECDYPDSEGRRIFEMLRKWSQINYGEVTVGVLISAIKESKVACEFEKLKHALSL